MSRYSLEERHQQDDIDWQVWDLLEGRLCGTYTSREVASAVLNSLREIEPENPARVDWNRVSQHIVAVLLGIAIALFVVFPVFWILGVFL